MKQFISAIFLCLSIAVFAQIDKNTNLNTIQKEQKKKELIGQLVTKLGEQKDIFGGTFQTRKIGTINDFNKAL